jgi:uncharacterized protein (TIGR03118 family)
MKSKPVLGEDDAFVQANDVIDTFGSASSDQDGHGRPRHDDDNQFIQTNLVSDGFVPAAHVDPNLVNPWGIALSATSPFWISDNGTGLTTLYDGAGNLRVIAGHSSITIATPLDQTTPATPTGDVSNIAGTGFDITSGGATASSRFIFATEDGTISGWSPSVNGGATTVLAVDHSDDGAVYKGLAIGTDADGTFLYATNFRNGTVDVFDSDFHQVNSFTDPTVQKGFAPFGIQVLGDHVFVTFAKQDADKHDDVAGPGNGYVDEFSMDGQLLDRVATRGHLDSPGDSRSHPPVSANSPVTFWSGISATAPLRYSILIPTSTLASWMGLTVNPSKSTACGLSCRATTAPIPTPTASISLPGRTASNMDCSGL